MSWIKRISYQAATGQLKRIYDKIKGENDYIDNILSAHSLRPNTLTGHMAIYKNVLHNRQNTLEKSLLETLGVYVSLLNGCTYCVEHHYAGLKRLLKDDLKADNIYQALSNSQPESYFSGKELALLRYAEILTVKPDRVEEDQINHLRSQGISDGEVLEANQVISYFAYANRTVLGLGVNLKGDVLGLSPNDSEDPDNWNHS
ncbi:MAG: carboxymuconolactone decarboxylase family protein [Saprospiraceae bacterium]